MTFRKLLASVVAMCLTVPALAQVPTLVNGNLETLDPYFSDIQIFNPIIRVPQGMRLYNLTRYRWINDNGSPATVTHSAPASSG